jgi:hypothetical protein
VVIIGINRLKEKFQKKINEHMLKHGGLAANGNCVAFSQEVSEPGKFVSKTL